MAIWPVSVRARSGNRLGSGHCMGLAALLASLGLAACTPLVGMKPPSVGGPRISLVELVPPRATAGCPVMLRLHVDSPHDDIVAALVGWVQARRRGARSGRAVLSVEREGSGGGSPDAVVAAFTLERADAYWYHVQVEDEAGRWSNVLDGRILVNPQQAGEGQRCS